MPPAGYEANRASDKDPRRTKLKRRLHSLPITWEMDDVPYKEERRRHIQD